MRDRFQQSRFLQCLLLSYFIVVTTLFRCNEGVLEINPTLCYPRRRILWLPWRCASSSAFRLFYRSLRSWHSSGSSRWLRHRCCTPTRGQWSWRCPENRVSAANKLPVRPTRNRILAIAVCFLGKQLEYSEKYSVSGASIRLIFTYSFIVGDKSSKFAWDIVAIK